VTLDDRRYHEALKRRDDALRDIAVIREERWALYLKPKPADEPHEVGCQKHASRYGDLPGAACTCESNRTRRRKAIFEAGMAGDLVIFDSLGSMGRMVWGDGQRSRLAGVRNPYE
jgi:hypothetical protein